MGVDKHDIRTVVHLDPPETAEAYIQEAGRAGRDGSPSKAIMLWSPADNLHFASFSKGSRAYAIHKFAMTTDCRRQVLLDALGAEQAVCSGCDLCDTRREIQQQKNRRKEKNKNVEDLVLAFICSHKKRYSKIELEGVLLPLLNKKSRTVCGLNTWEHSSIAEMLYQLEKAGKIRICTWPWKNKVTAQEKITLLKQNQPFYSLYSRQMQTHRRLLSLRSKKQQEPV
jgi:ATP-dependent DNA helicase RecQ